MKPLGFFWIRLSYNNYWLYILSIKVAVTNAVFIQVWPTNDAKTLERSRSANYVHITKIE